MQTNLFDTIFDQMGHVRSQTLELVEGVTEELADRIPEGFRNNIRWQLGHVYLATEAFSLMQLNLPLQLPEGFMERYAYSTTPQDEAAKSFPVLTIPELVSMLKEQPDRIRETFPISRLNESVSPLTTSTGLDLLTPEQSIRYCLYHEGLHFGTINAYKKILSR
ncbi:DinB family protein [Paenibacillus gansuensis]|uniref:DinB family protein n=1 Tax=Paenibacillus gansuensis TaxID=306542 RepID=A0ABW5P9F8_9BACL